MLFCLVSPLEIKKKIDRKPTNLTISFIEFWILIDVIVDIR
ncbi:hypothetical protein ACFL28_01175 [Candidatus Omnitrophota bacterium]